MRSGLLNEAQRRKIHEDTARPLHIALSIDLGVGRKSQILPPEIVASVAEWRRASERDN